MRFVVGPILFGIRGRGNRWGCGRPGVDTEILAGGTGSHPGTRAGRGRNAGCPVVPTVLQERRCNGHGSRDTHRCARESGLAGERPFLPLHLDLRSDGLPGGLNLEREADVVARYPLTTRDGWNARRRNLQILGWGNCWSSLRADDRFRICAGSGCCEQRKEYPR